MGLRAILWRVSRAVFGHRPAFSFVVVAVALITAEMQAADVEQWWIVPVIFLILLSAALGLSRSS